MPTLFFSFASCLERLFSEYAQNIMIFAHFLTTFRFCPLSERVLCDGQIRNLRKQISQPKCQKRKPETEAVGQQVRAPGLRDIRDHHPAVRAGHSALKIEKGDVHLTDSKSNALEPQRLTPI
jgi:hypothetical protein